MSSIMTNRTLSHSTVSSDGSQQYVINYSNLEGFQLEIVQRINEFNTKISSLEGHMATLKDMVAWIGRHRPEAINDYFITKTVINRLEDSSDFSGADMKQEMQVTP